MYFVSEPCWLSAYELGYQKSCYAICLKVEGELKWLKTSMDRCCK